MSCRHFYNLFAILPNHRCNENNRQGQPHSLTCTWSHTPKRLDVLKILEKVNLSINPASLVFSTSTSIIKKTVLATTEHRCSLIFVTALGNCQCFFYFMKKRAKCSQTEWKVAQSTSCNVQGLQIKNAIRNNSIFEPKQTLAKLNVSVCAIERNRISEPKERQWQKCYIGQPSACAIK